MAVIITITVLQKASAFLTIIHFPPQSSISNKGYEPILTDLQRRFGWAFLGHALSLSNTLFYNYKCMKNYNYKKFYRIGSSVDKRNSSKNVPGSLNQEFILEFLLLPFLAFSFFLSFCLSFFLSLSICLSSFLICL